MTDRQRTTHLGRARAPATIVHGVRPRVFYGVFAVLFAGNVAAGLALLTTPQIAGLIDGHMAATLSSYEDRINTLRLEVDRLHSRQYAQTGDINIELQELAQQQEMLSEQHQYVKALAEKAAQLGISDIAGSAAPASDGPAGNPAGSSAAATPVPLAPPGGRDASLSTSDAGPAAIQEAGRRVRQMMDDSHLALAAISAAAGASTDEILDSLESVGIKPDLPAATDADAEAMGGPLLPPEPDGTDDAPSVVDDANAVVSALTRFKSAREALAEAPIHLPVAGPERISSGFGNRTDPFTGRQAFHPGIDFPWPTGTTVMAAGEGKVIFVGQINGYGNCIDIDHGGGIVTRYGHLSAFIAHQGETVDAGTPIARVGSTGRSTGPHLHFEVRRNDQPVDPSYFLAVGRRLAHFLGVTPPALATDSSAGPGGSDADALG